VRPNSFERSLRTRAVMIACHPPSEIGGEKSNSKPVVDEEGTSAAACTVAVANIKRNRRTIR